MSKAIDSAAGEAMPVAHRSRRSALAMLGGVASLAVARTLAAAAPVSAAPVDPIFAALDEHRALHHWSNERGTDDDETERRTSIVDEKRDALIETAPATLAGACALLMRIAETESFFIESDDPLMRVVRNVAKALASIDPNARAHIPLSSPLATV